jgi:hypothetical protein
MRKILKNYSKSKRLNGVLEGKIGTILGLIDKDKNFLLVGDTIRYGNYEGVILYEPERKGYGVALTCSMWYGDDKYDINSYGKFIDLPMDNGARMEIELINREK